MNVAFVVWSSILVVVVTRAIAGVKGFSSRSPLAPSTTTATVRETIGNHHRDAFGRIPTRLKAVHILGIEEDPLENDNASRRRRASSRTAPTQEGTMIRPKKPLQKQPSRAAEPAKEVAAPEPPRTEPLHEGQMMAPRRKPPPPEKPPVVATQAVAKPSTVQSIPVAPHNPSGLKLTNPYGIPSTASSNERHMVAPRKAAAATTPNDNSPTSTKSTTSAESLPPQRTHPTSSSTPSNNTRQMITPKIPSPQKPPAAAATAGAVPKPSTQASTTRPLPVSPQQPPSHNHSDTVAASSKPSQMITPRISSPQKPSAAATDEPAPAQSTASNQQQLQQSSTQSVSPQRPEPPTKRAAHLAGQDHDLRLKDPAQPKLVYHATAYGSSYEADHFRHTDKKGFREWNAGRTKAKRIHEHQNPIGGLGREVHTGEVLRIEPKHGPPKKKRLVLHQDGTRASLDVAKGLIAGRGGKRQPTKTSPTDDDDLEKEYELYQREQLREDERKNYEFDVERDVLDEILASKERAARAAAAATTKAPRSQPASSSPSSPDKPSAKPAKKAFDVLMDE